MLILGKFSVSITGNVWTNVTNLMRVFRLCLLVSSVAFLGTTHFKQIFICVFSGREKIIFYGFEEEYNFFLLSSISQFTVGDGFRFDVPNWVLPIIAINERPSIVCND